MLIEGIWYTELIDEHSDKSTTQNGGGKMFKVKKILSFVFNL